MRVVTLAVVVLATVLNIEAKRAIETKAADCAAETDGTFIYDTCASFYVCYGGEAILQNCALGSYFDETQGTCLPDTADVCPENAVQCDVENAFIENPADCTAFYVCYEGKLVEQSCGTGSYFDADNSYCTPDTDGVCTPLECTEDGAFSPNLGNCSTFYVCYENKLVEQSCGVGSYFDADNLYCAPDADGVCSPTECADDGEFSANLANCSMFYVCYDGKLVDQSCGAGSYFDTANSYCIPDVDNVCWTVEPTTPAPCQCPGGYQDGDFVPNPDSCYLYFICSGGQLLEQDCGNGNYFDANTKTCEKDVNNVCWPEETTTTEAPPSCSCPGGYVEGDFVPNPDTCYLYSICSEGQLLEQDCGTGNYFDANTKTCEKDVNNVCWPEETTTTEAPPSCSCPGGYAEGDFVPNPDTCYLYSICSEGQLLEQDCGKGNYFDANTKMCEKDVNNVCWPEETTTTEAPPSCSCPGGYAEGDFVPNPDTCYLYSICSEGQLLEQDCGKGNYFDANTKMCEKDVNNVCWPEETTTTEAPPSCSCPGGYAEGDFVPNPDTCYLYSICSEGQLLEQDCGKGNYFDANTKMCEKDVNNVCWPEETTTTEAPPSCSCPGGYTEGDFVPNPETCYLYSICSEGQLLEQDCGTGNYFDANTKTCEKDVNNVCWQEMPTTTTTTEVRASCPEGLQESDLIENLASCSFFFICNQGKLEAQSCGNGNYFNRTIKACARDTRGFCWPNSNTTAPLSTCPGGYAESDLVENSDSCSSFFVCSNGNLVAQSCGNGNYFNRSIKACARDTRGFCWPNSNTTAPLSTCPGGYAESDLVENSDSCSSFFVCSNGNLVAQSCGNGNYFNRTIKACARDTRGFCWPNSNTTAPLSTCPGGYAESDLVENSDSCSSFFVCSNGNLVAQSCGNGNYFNRTIKACARDTRGFCWPNSNTTAPLSTCPGGYAESDLVENSDSCSSFFVCSNGNLVAQSCGNGNYFNRTIKACARDTRGFCWPNSNTTAPVSTCPGGYAESDLVENSDSCSSFFVCSNGNLVAQTCGRGNYFSTAIKGCALDSKGVCWEQSKTKSETESPASGATPTQASVPTSRLEKQYSCPEGQVDGDVLPHPSNCSLFYACMDKKLVELTCDYGNYFDTGLKSCVLDTFGVCWEASSSGEKGPASEPLSLSVDVSISCPGGHNDGDFAPYPSNCSMFYICFDGKLIELSCGLGNYFENSLMNCMLDTQGVCWQPSRSSEATNTSSTTQSSITTSDQPFSCPDGYDDGDFVAYPKNCFMFYFCFNGELIERSCGYGNYFDNSSKNCLLDTVGVCWQISRSITEKLASKAEASASMVEAVFACPEGYDDGDFAAYPNNCSMFYVCDIGRMVVKSCGYGNYFNSISRSCLLDTSGVCWQPSSPSTTKTSKTSKTKSTTEAPASTTEALGTTVAARYACPEGFVDGDFAAYPSNCSMFYVCDIGRMVVKSCGYGNYFNSTSRSCLLDTSGVCWQPSSPSTTKTSKTSKTQSTTEEPVSTTEALGTTVAARYACPKGYVDGDFAAYPSNCSMFYVCDIGRMVEKSCGYGNYFNSTSKSCVLDTSGICWQALSSSKTQSTIENPTPSAQSSTPAVGAPYSCSHGLAHGEFAPYPKSCFMFYFCFNGELIEQSCGYGNYFENSSKSCVLDTLGLCWQVQRSSAATTSFSATRPTAEKQTSPLDSLQPCLGGEQDGDFVPSPNNCSMFYVCHNGKSFEESCGYGSYFDSSSKSCILDILGVCWKVSTPPTTTTAERLPSTTPSTANSGPLIDVPRSCAGGFEYGDFVPYPNNCSMFFICYDGKLMEESCGYGSYFDNSSKSCVLDILGVCWKAPIASTTMSIPSTTPTTTTTRPLPTVTSTVPPSTSRLSSTSSPSTVTSAASPTIASSTTTESTSTSFTDNPHSCLSGYNDGELFPYHDNCSMFYVCYKGLLFVETCGYNNYFDRSAKQCVFDATGGCWQASDSSPTNGGPSTPASTTTAPSLATQATTISSDNQKSGCSNGFADGEFMAHPTSCYQFLVCYQGEVIEVTCGFGNYFDATARSCVLDKQGICWSELTSPSPTHTTLPPTTVAAQATRTCPGGYADGEFAPVPEICDSFFVCTQGELVTLSCGKGNYFDDTTKSCVFDKRRVCWTDIELDQQSVTETALQLCSNGLREGQLIAHQESCFEYDVCNQGQLVKRSCGMFNYFNPTTSECQPDSDGKCWPTQPTAQTETKKIECPNGLGEGQFIASPSSCFLFQICSNGELVEGNCGTFNYFNPTTKNCEKDSSGICWPAQPTPETKQIECPNGLKEGQLTAHPSSCYSYQVCSNGELVERSCGMFSFFNPLTKICDRDSDGKCWPTQPTAQTETKQIECPNGLGEGQFIANPSSCFLFQICSNGELVEGNCGTFNYFNPTTKNCERDSSGICWPVQPTTLTETKQIECPNGLKEGQLKAHPSSCYSYQVCSNGELVERSCGMFSFFNPLTKICDRDSDGKCWPTQPTAQTETKQIECPNGLGEGQFIANPSSCFLFQICSNGELVEGNCGTFNYFNPTTKNCERDSSGICWPVQPTTLTETKQIECPNGLKEGQLKAHPSSCYSYQVCSNGELVERSCGMFSFFNPTTNICDRDSDGICWPTQPTAQTEMKQIECPNGLGEGQFIANPSSCFLFQICSNGELVEGNCGTFNYFNPTTKNCERDSSGICWPAQPTPETKQIECPNGLKEGQLTAHPSSCYSYQVCSNGELVERSCGMFSFFNPLTKICDRDSDGKCWPTQPTAQTETKQIECPNGLGEGQFIANPSSCFLFQICSNGELVEGNCGTFNYFNPTTKNCERDSSGICWPAQPTPETKQIECPNGLKEGQLTAHPSSCYSYQVCSNGELVERSCGMFSFFNPTTNICDRDSDGKCWPTQPTAQTETKQIECPNGLGEGQFIANPSSCFLFQICSNGELVEGNCGTFNYFNPTTKNCERDSSGICWPAQPTPETKQIECPNGLKEGQLTAHPSSCYSYQVCSNGELVERSCGMFSFFNPLTKICDRDSDGKCWPTQPTAQTETKQIECPNGLGEGQFIANPSSCFLFQICSNGELVEGNCGTFNYFNPTTKNCERDSSGICWPVQPTTLTETKQIECPNGLKEGQLKAHPSSCYSYQVCSNGELVERSCGMFSFFNPTTNICDRDSDGICWPTQPTAQTEMKQIECPNGLGEGQFIANPSSCFLFQICSNGELVEGNCGTFNYFNPTTKNCERDSSGICWPAQPTPETKQIECPNGLKEGQLTAHPSSCYSYQVCSNGELVERSCGMFSFFNPTTNICDRDSDGKCWPTQPAAQTETKQIECPNGLGEGQFIANPSSCFLFQICSNGELVEGNCGTFNYFNPTTKNCERDSSGICWPAQPTPETKQIECPNGLKEGQLTAHPSSCYSYQVCSNGELVERSCGMFSFFNPTTNICDRDSDGICWPTQPTAQTEMKQIECPNGLGEGQFIANPSSCFLFQICSNGELVEGNCGTFNYFNPTTKNCERDSSGICWPAQPTPETKQIECPNGLKEGQLTAHPSSCYSYQVCSNGELVERSCGMFSFFNPTTNICDRDSDGKCWPTQPAAQTETKQIECPNGLGEGQFIANPSSCFLFQICSKGELVEGNCGTFNYFNPTTKNCERDSSGICWPAQPTPETKQIECPNGLKEGQLTAHPSSCYSYQVCSNGELVERSCGMFSFFNPTTNICDRDSDGKCWPTQPAAQTETKQIECPNGLGEGQFIANPSSCFLFQICSNGELVEGNCGTFNYFNPTTKNCERDSSGICWPVQPTTLTETKQIECPNGLREGQFIASPTSCVFYHICSNGELVEGNCGTFNFFNSITNECERDSSGVCWPVQPTTLPEIKRVECPNGLGEGQFIANPSSCFLYQICSNGELVESNCGTFNYFNPTTKTCERDSSGICWPAQPTPETKQIECPNGLKEGQLTAHPSSCYSYQVCSNGELVERSCGMFSFFNPTTNICDRDSDGICWPTQPTAQTETKQIECPNGLGEGQFIANPSSCFLFQICSNGELVEGNCGTYNYFNPTTKNCEKDSSGICWPTQPTAQTETKQISCPNGLGEGQFIASPSSCFLYQICSNGELVEGNCGTFNYFNPTTKNCERDSSGICWPVQPTTLTETKQIECPNGLREGQFIASPSSCFLYQICSNGELVEGNCGTFNYFNPTTKNCEKDSSGICWPTQSTAQTETKQISCPNGLGEGQFIASPSSCFLYQICSNGELVEGNCGTFNYFNPTTKNCEKDSSGICWPTQSTAQTETKQISCPNGLGEGQFIASPSSCFLYQICSNGELVEGNCGTFNYFNPTTKNCEKDSSGICWPARLTESTEANPIECETETTPKACPNGQLEGQFSAHPSSCSSYLICNAGELVESNCGAGNYFNANTNICEPDTNGVCCPVTPEAPTQAPVKECPNGLSEGQFAPNPGSCSHYYICSGGELVEGDCGFENYFNANENICERDTKRQCWPERPTPPPRPTPPSPPASKPCPKGTVNGQFLANPSSCHLYHICNNGQLVDSDCGSGSIFNRTTQICEPDLLGICWPSSSKPCPIGMLSGEFIANPSSCQKYYICYNGQLLKSDCGSGNIFNRTTQICEPDVMGICDPANAQPPISNACPAGVQNGQFIANPSSCQQYYICNNGQLLSSDCGSGNFFNKVTQICEPDVNGICNPSNALPPNSKPCPVGALNGQFIANPSSCQQYYICNNGQLLNSDCGSGNIFNRTTQICEPDVMGICDPANAQPPISNACPAGVQNGQFIANPSSCQQYYICNNGQLLSSDCGSGNFFNKVTQICEPDVNGVCCPSTANSNACPAGVQNGQFIANPLSCQQYYICNNGQLLSSDCGSGNFFNKVTQICEPDVNGVCCPSTANSNACPAGVQNGQFIANPSSCQQYYICNNGQLLSSDCGSGNFFNKVTQICEPDVNGICNPSNALPPNSKPCPVGALNGQFIANPSSCQQYYICNNGQLLNSDCGSGNIFNRTTQICEPDVMGICDPANAQPPISNACPAGVQNGQFIANPSSCQQYYICNNGQLLSSDCGSGNFFNNLTQICEPDVNGVCCPSTANSNACPAGVQNGQFIANPSSCQQYYICNNGQLLSSDCGSGNFFNNLTQICEPDVNGICNPSNALPPNFKPCPVGVQNGQFIANPSSCQKYYICNNGQLLNSDCGRERIFNRTTQICEPDVLGICTPFDCTTCPNGVRNGQFIPVPGECDKFMICNEGTLIQQECGVGYFFDVDSKYCIRDVAGTCWTAQISSETCVGQPDGTFLPNDAACNKFFMCYNNTKISQECGVGNVFNSGTLTCVRDTLGTCWKKVPNVCANNPIGSFVPNPANCQEFYVCHANRAVLQQCGNGNYFNRTQKICQPDVNGVCINVCQGIEGNVSLPHSNCNQFYTCSNGLTTGVGTCRTGTNFDALAHICLTTAVCEANVCAKSPNGVVYPVQDDPFSFYSCYNQMALKLACPEGTAFDAVLSICTPDTGRCVGRRNGFTVASSNNPNAYYVCKNSMAIFEQCPSYAIFDEKKGVCVQAQRKRIASNICSGEPDGGLLPGDACNTYHLCLDGEVVDQNCGAYSAFSPKLGYCVFNLSCFDKNEICAKASDIDKFPDARRQTTYVRCKNGVALSEKCPSHLIYSHELGSCVPPEMTMSEDELEELCEDNDDNTMAPALDCRKFYICRKNVAILQQCAVDQYFDTSTGSCQPDVDRECWQKSETLRRSFFLKSVCIEDRTRTHPTDCTRYDTCSYGMWMEKWCPKRQIFDATARSCVPGDANKVCPHARSAAQLECSNEQPLRPSDEACTDYYGCEDNRWELKRCPVGEFFNPLAATCSRDISACARVPSTKNSRCVSNETIASDTNCGLFYICYEGEWWYRHCAEGTYFNKSQNACAPNDGTCRLTSEKGPCKSGAAMLSDFNPCSAYHLCLDGNWTVQYCPAGHHFNESRKACMQDDEEGECRSGVRIQTSPCVDGDRRHQTSNCAAFDICSFGKWLSVPCPQGSYFDMSLRRCIPNRGDCSADRTLRRDCVEGTSRPSQHNCTEFYFCAKGKWYVESCLRGFQYNATIDKCIQTNATCPVKPQINWPQSRCPDAEAVTSVAHETNCSMYYLCVHGLAVEADCAFGQFYDEKSKRCRLNNGSCVHPLPAPSDGVCKQKSNGSQVQNPANCTSYYTCTDAIAVLSYCPVGEYFNPTAGACQTDTGECNKIELCNNATGDSVPHETFCNIYYSCVRGLAIPVACDDGQLFDPRTKKCATDVHKRCVNGTLVGDAVCLSGEENQPKEDTDDCAGYIMCSNGTAQRLQCPQGQFFNTSALTCALNDGSCLKASNATEVMSCTGRHGYLMADLEHCNEFYVCINGALQHDRCVAGEYFDATTRRCMGGNQTCSAVGELPAQCDEDSNFADQSDCRKYFQCNNAELQSKKCRTGESFDTLLGFCRQNDGTCLLENGQRVGACAGKHGKVAADEENCRGYFTCINGQKISEECELDEFFDKTTNTCRKDLNNTCTPVDTELVNKTQLSCAGLTELVFYPNAIDGCKTFYQCVKGTPRIHKCPDDLLYNGVSGTCDWKDYVKCIDMTDHHHTDELCVNAKNGTRYGNTEDNCDSYFICTNGKLNSFKCDSGLKFSANLDKCDLAANVNCTMTSQI